ncbi:MAG: helix-turn-helix transcriptional regulator [Bacteroidota bacterium]
MKDTIKEVAFAHRKTTKSHFDLVPLEKLLQLSPEDHSQFEHHKVAFYVLLIITEGTGIHSINYEDFSFKKGTVFALRKSTIHKFHKTNAKGILLIFTSDFAVRFSDFKAELRISQLFNEFLGSPKLQLDTSGFAEIESLTGQIEKEFRSIHDDQTGEIIRNLVQVLILKLYRLQSKKYKNPFNTNYLLRFIQLQEQIENKCFENKKVAFYASEMGVTTKTLNTITQHVVGKSAKSFIDEIVIMKIKRLLVNRKFSFTEVAYTTGFNEPTNFFKFFRKKTGLSPKEFRKATS